MAAKGGLPANLYRRAGRTRRRSRRTPVRRTAIRGGRGTTGPGRFWGYRGLHPVLAAGQVAPAIGIAVGRVLRRWYRAKGLTKCVLVQRVDQETGRVWLRRSTKRRRLFVQVVA